MKWYIYAHRPQTQRFDNDTEIPILKYYTFDSAEGDMKILKAALDTGKSSVKLKGGTIEVKLRDPYRTYYLHSEFLAGPGSGNAPYCYETETY